MQPVRALQSTGKSKACFTWHYAFVKNSLVTPNQKEINVLKENFPSCFNADGTFDIVRFSEFLKDKVDISHEGYELKFLGKNYAKMLASLDTETVIVPDAAITVFLKT